MPKFKDETEKKLSYKSFTFELKSVESITEDGEEFGVFAGAMASEDRDRGGDIIAPDAFDESLQRYKDANRPIRLFYNHNRYDLPIGIIPIESVVKSGTKWNVTGKLNLGTQSGREVYSLLKQKALSDMSIGYTALEEEYEKGNRYIKKLELWEASVVPEPMNTGAKITDVKSDDDNCKYKIDDVSSIHSKKEFEEILRESGVFSRKAAVYLASCFERKTQSESDDVKNSDDEAKIMQLLSDIKSIINKS